MTLRNTICSGPPLCLPVQFLWCYFFVDVLKSVEQECMIKDVIIAPYKLSSMVVLATPKDDDEGQVLITLIKFPVLSSCFSELCLLAEKQSILMGTIGMSSTSYFQLKCVLR